MKELTYQQIIEIAQREKALTVKTSPRLLLVWFINRRTNTANTESMSMKRSSKKMRDLAQLIKDESITVFSDSNDYHNLAVDYARQELFDCAIWILKRGLKNTHYPRSACRHNSLWKRKRATGRVWKCAVQFAPRRQGKLGMEGLFIYDRLLSGWDQQTSERGKP